MRHFGRSRALKAEAITTTRIQRGEINMKNFMTVMAMTMAITLALIIMFSANLAFADSSQEQSGSQEQNMSSALTGGNVSVQTGDTTAGATATVRDIGQSTVVSTGDVANNIELTTGSTTQSFTDESTVSFTDESTVSFTDESTVSFTDGNVNVETGSVTMTDGDVDVVQTDGDVDVVQTDGDVDVVQTDGDVDVAQTVGDNIQNVSTLEGADFSVNLDSHDTYYNYSWTAPALLNTSHENLAFKQRNAFGNIPSELRFALKDKWHSNATFTATLNAMKKFQPRAEEAIKFLTDPAMMLFKVTAKVSGLEPTYANQALSLEEMVRLEEKGAQFTFIATFECNPKLTKKTWSGGEKLIDEELIPTDFQKAELANAILRKFGSEYTTEVNLEFVWELFKALEEGLSIGAFVGKILQGGAHAAYGAPSAAIKSGGQSHAGYTRNGNAYVGYIIDFIEPNSDTEYEKVKPFLSDEIIKAYEAVAHCPDPTLSNAEKRWSLLNVLSKKYEEAKERDDKEQMYVLIVLMRDTCKQGINDLKGNNTERGDWVRNKIMSYRGLTWAWNADLVGENTPEGRSCRKLSQKYFNLASK